MAMFYKTFFFWVFSGLVLYLGFLCPLQGQQINTELISEHCMPAVVLIETDDGNGSGFLVNKEGYIVTNYHVISSVYPSHHRIKIKFKDSKTYTCLKIVDINTYQDMAILLIEPQPNRTVLPMHNMALKQGASVAALGNPRGIGFTLTAGVLSNLSPNKREPHLLQTDVPVNPGNSGGPLVDKQGLVVGVIVARLERRGFGDRDVQNINFAIKSENVRAFLDRNKVKYGSSPLISEDQLAGRKLSAEEEEKIKETNLKRLELEEEKERERIQKEKQKDEEIIALEKQKEADRIQKERQNIALSAQQEKLLREQDYSYRQERQGQEHEQEKRRLERLHQKQIQDIENQERLARANVQDEERRVKESLLQVEKDKQRFYEQRRRYFASRPPHFSLRLGGTALAFAGTVNDFQEPSLSGSFRADVAYRMDIDQSIGGSKGRGSAFGIFTQIGLLPGSTLRQVAQAQNWAINGPLKPQQLFMELEVGGTWREWLRFSGGWGQQYLRSDQELGKKSYYLLSPALLARFGAIEVELGTSLLFGQAWAEPALRGHLGLLVHLGMGKW